MTQLKTVRTQVIRTVAETDDWMLVCDACSPSRKISSLSRWERDQLYTQVWDYSDGYGEPGYVPPQGYDWSGIRDSSAVAKGRMARAVKAYFNGRGITQYVVELIDYQTLETK